MIFLPLRFLDLGLEDFAMSADAPPLLLNAGAVDDMDLESRPVSNDNDGRNVCCSGRGIARLVGRCTALWPTSDRAPEELRTRRG